MGIVALAGGGKGNGGGSWAVETGIGSIGGGGNMLEF